MSSKDTGNKAVEISLRCFRSGEKGATAGNRSNNRETQFFMDTDNGEALGLFCQFGPDLRLTYANQAFCCMVDMGLSELKSTNILSLIPQEYHQEIIMKLRKVTPGHPAIIQEYCSEKGGRWRLWWIRALSEQNGEPSGYRARGRDITHYKEAEIEVQHRLQVEHAIAECSQLLNTNGKVDLESLLQLLGRGVGINRVALYELDIDHTHFSNTCEWCDQDTPALKNVRQKMNLNDYSWWLNKIRQGKEVINNVELLPDEAEGKSKIRNAHIGSLAIVSIFNSDGLMKGCLSFERMRAEIWREADIHCLQVAAEMLGHYWERKRIIAALQKSEERFQLLAAMTPALTYVSFLQSDQPLLYTNDAFRKLTGFSPEECAQMTGREFIYPEDRERLGEEELGRLKEGIKSPGLAVRLLTKAGEVRDGVLLTRRVQWEEQEAVIGVFNDFTECKRLQDELLEARNELELKVEERTAQLKKINANLQKEIMGRRLFAQKLQNSEANFRTLADTSPALIWVIQDDQLKYVNKELIRVTGYNREELLSMDPWKLISPELCHQLKENMARRFEGQTIIPYEVSFFTREGRQIWGMITASIIKYQDKPALLGVMLDITQKRLMEAELLKKDRLKALGILAGGLAHDFNNILTVISGNLSLARMIMSGEESEILELLAEAEKGALQARELTMQLLTFSRGGAPIKETSSLPELIQESIAFAVRGSNCRYIFSLPNDLWPADIDRGQISQVIHNLVINACQAMPQGGVIRVECSNIRILDNFCSLPKGRYVKIAIRDEGAGIPPEKMGRIFDPYFTTKSHGQGLGLTMAHSIISKHGGEIQVKSTLGKGSSFEIYLPASENKVSQKKHEGKKIIGGQGRILAMDDEELLRQTLKRMLNQLGYEVQLTKDGGEAIACYEQALVEGRPYAAVIMDLTVAGGLGGQEATRKLRQIDPGLKAIVSSGYSEDPVMADYKKYGFDGYIAKPYTIENLDQVLRQIISPS